MSGITHEWNGTILTITSDSGTSSCDLKGDKGDDGIRGPQGPAGKDGVGGGSSLELDTTLTVEGAAADAKAVGEAIAAIDFDAPVDSVNGKTGAVVLSAEDVGALPDTYKHTNGDLQVSKSYPSLYLFSGNANEFGRVFVNDTLGLYFQHLLDDGKLTLNVNRGYDADKRIRVIDNDGTNTNTYYVIHTGNMNAFLPQTFYQTSQPTNWKNGDIWLKPAE